MNGYIRSVWNGWTTCVTPLQELVDAPRTEDRSSDRCLDLGVALWAAIRIALNVVATPLAFGPTYMATVHM
jgi:hypothetical protein